MTINLTLAVQAINFLIAYLMIKKLFLQPAVASITEDDEAIALARAQLEAKEEAIIQEEQRIAQRLCTFKKTFLEHEPDVAQALERAITIVPGMPPLPTIDQKEVRELAKKTAHKLIDEVAHVD